MPNIVEFSGVIGSVSEDGHTAIVDLDQPIGSIRFAVISATSKGRVKLMNGKGRLVNGVHVGGRASIGVEALEAISVIGVQAEQGERQEA